MDTHTLYASTHHESKQAAQENSPLDTNSCINIRLLGANVKTIMKIKENTRIDELPIIFPKYKFS